MFLKNVGFVFFPSLLLLHHFLFTEFPVLKVIFCTTAQQRQEWRSNVYKIKSEEITYLIPDVKAGL